MKFKLETYVKFIDLVRIHPMLYDSSLPSYKDAKLDIWEKITLQMNEDTMGPNDWKGVWKQKRDKFVKKRKEHQEFLGGNSTLTQFKQWPLYDRMLFLTDHLKGKGYGPTTNTVTEETQPDDWPTSLKLECTEDETSSDFNEAMSQSAIESPASSSWMSSSRKRPSGERIEQLMEQMNARSVENLNIVKSTISQLSKKEDETNIFTFLHKKIKSFSRETQDWVEDEVYKIYTEARQRERRLNKRVSK